MHCVVNYITLYIKDQPKKFDSISSQYLNIVIHAAVYKHFIFISTFFQLHNTFVFKFLNAYFTPNLYKIIHLCLN